MPDNTYSTRFDAFHYNSPNQTGLRITDMSPAFPEGMRAPLQQFMCSVNFGGELLDERLVYCPPLNGFCKIFISRDALYARDYFYHGVTVGEKSFNNEFNYPQDPFVNRMRALLQLPAPTGENAQTAQVQNTTLTLAVIETDYVSGLYKQSRAHLSRLVYLAFRPVLSLGKFAATFRFPAGLIMGAERELASNAALFVLCVLPEEMHSSVRMRFTDDPATIRAFYDCNYLFSLGNTEANFDYERPAPLRDDEDPLGIFTALGGYIADFGLAAYRANILPLISKWTFACKQGGHYSFDFLYLLLRGVPQLQLPDRQVDLNVTAQFFSNMDADWFSHCAGYLLQSLRSIPNLQKVRAAAESNPLFSRTADELSADGKDPFFLVYAGLCSGGSYDENAAVVQSLFDRWSESENGRALLVNMKSVMGLTLKIPADATPMNIFEGVRTLERKNPVYAKYAADTAVDGYVASLEAEWIDCLHTLHTDPATAQAVSEVLDIRSEDLLAAAQDRKTIGWVCGVCKTRAAANPVFRQTVISALLAKRISYEELLQCLRAMGASDQDLPEQPKSRRLPDSVNSLQALAEVKPPKKSEELPAAQAGILERLCLLLEEDCTWEDFKKYIPVILANAKFRPTLRIQPKIEKLLLRQLAVLATDILVMQGGQDAYAGLLVQLREEFCLCLYPVSGAAAGKFDKKKLNTAKFKKFLHGLLPYVCLFLTVFFVVSVLFVILPILPGESSLQQIVPAVFGLLGLLLLIVQTLIVRRLSTADYLLPCAVVMLAAGLLALLW